MILVAGDSNHDKQYYDGKVKIWTEQIDADVLNVAKSGYGNDQICNAVIKAVEENNVDYVIVLWTIWYRVLKQPVKLWNRFNELKSLENNKKYDDWLNFDQCNDYVFSENMNRIYLLQSFLKNKNIPYTFYQDLWAWPNLQHEQNLDTAKQITNHPLYDLIDKDNFWGWPIFTWLGGKYLADLSVDRLSDTDAHYGQKTHDLFAKLLMKGVKQYGKTH